MRGLHGFLLVVLASTSAALAGPLVSSTFDTDDEGWGLTDSLLGSPEASVVHSAAGGNPGGHIASPGLVTRSSFSAPAAFLGNWLAMGVTFISYDLNVAAAFHRTSTLHLVLTNGTLAIGYYAATPSTGAWVHSEIPVDSHTGWRYACNSVNDCGAVTAADFASVLSNLAGVRVVADFEQLSAENPTLLDNFRLNGPDSGTGNEIPEPSPALLLGTALLAWAAAGRRRTTEIHPR